MKKIIGACVIIALTGCYHSIESNTSEQIESSENVYNVNDLSICKKAEIKDTNIFYSSTFDEIDTNDIYDLYYNNSTENNYILLSPIKMMPYTKVNETPIFFIDKKDKTMIEDGSQKFEINQNYSHMDTSSLTECTITVYFYPIVLQNERDELLLKKVQMNHQTYCDGIYEIRINEI